MTIRDAYNCINEKNYSEGFEGEKGFSQHVCDFDLHERVHD